MYVSRVSKWRVFQINRILFLKLTVGHDFCIYTKGTDTHPKNFIGITVALKLDEKVVFS